MIRAQWIGLSVGIVAAGTFTLGIGLSRPTVRLAAFSTSLDARNAAQRHNALLAVQQLDDRVVAAHGVFSFVHTVGSFSRDAGYRKAPVSYNGQLIDSWGGGVCQVSTTLYNAALLSGMKIIERHRHRFWPGYVGPGRDAGVAYDDIDLKFENPYSYPVTIRASVDSSRVQIVFVARSRPRVLPEVVSVVKDVAPARTVAIGSGREYGRVRNSGKDGCEVAVYRIYPDRRELVSEDWYPAMNRVIDYR